MKLSIKINTSGRSPVLLLPLQRRRVKLLGKCWKMKALNAYCYAFIQSRSWSLYHPIFLQGGNVISHIGEQFQAHEENGQTPSFMSTDGQMLWSVSWCIHITLESERGEEREKSEGSCQNWQPAPALEYAGPPWKAFILVLSSVIIRLLVYVPAKYVILLFFKIWPD